MLSDLLNFLGESSVIVLSLLKSVSDSTVCSTIESSFKADF